MTRTRPTARQLKRPRREPPSAGRRGLSRPVDARTVWLAAGEETEPGLTLSVRPSVNSTNMVCSSKRTLVAETVMPREGAAKLCLRMELAARGAPSSLTARGRRRQQAKSGRLYRRHDKVCWTAPLKGRNGGLRSAHPAYALFRPQPIKGPRNTCSGAVEITRKTVTAAPML